MTTITAPVGRYHKISHYRGYRIPATAVAGASDTGRFPDSPCPTDEVEAELKRLRTEALAPLKIVARLRYGASTNACCAKRWLVVSRGDFERAAQATLDWLKANESSTHYIHAADLVVPEKEAA